MSYNQSKWLYDILQEHGFDVCVDAFKQNISVLERKDDLDKFVKYHLKRLSITTVNRQDYLQGEIRKCEKTMRDSIGMAHDEMFCSVYNVVDIIYNYVAAEAVKSELLVRNKECSGRELQNAQHSRYLHIATMLKDTNNDNVVDDIVGYVRREIENNGRLIGGKGFIDYVLERLHNGTELDIWASGSKWLDEKRTENVFEKLALLRLEQFDADENGKTRAIEECNNTKLQQKQATLKSRQETERERKYFDKAINAGLMEEADSGYRWLHNNGMKASLVYFLKQIYNPYDSSQTPFKMLEKLFSVKYLATATYRLFDVKKEQKWRSEIDALFKE